jgi:hypothetical protein
MPTRKILFFSAIFIIAIWGIYFALQKINNKSFPQKAIQPQAENIINMQITSPAFKNNENIPSKYTCDGENINPQLEIYSVPENTKSLALIVDDPDAPRGNWTHWVVWNIDPATKEIAEHSVPAGAIEGKTSYGRPGYKGPCPPDKTHRYYFKIYALDTNIDLPPSADTTNLENAMDGHILASEKLLGIYSR